MYQDTENPDPRRGYRTAGTVDAVDVQNDGAPVDASTAGDLPAGEVTGGPPNGLDRGRLVPAEAVDRLRDQWRDAQSTFVDDPSEAVARTRTLLTDFVRSMADQLDERGRRPVLDTSTEDLRQELRQYRAAFDQLAEV